MLLKIYEWRCRDWNSRKELRSLITAENSMAREVDVVTTQNVECQAK